MADNDDQSVGSEKGPKELRKEVGLVNPDFMVTSLATDLLQKKRVEYSAETQANTEKAIGRMNALFVKAVEGSGLSINNAEALDKLANTLDEAHGNFGKEKISFPDFVAALADDQFEVKLISVDPLEYLGDVGNIASVESLRDENNRLPEEIRNIENPAEKAKAIVAFIDETHHVGVDDEMYRRDLARGKDHNETMKYLLNKISVGEALAPGFVGRFAGAAEKYGQGKTGEALDGTHRATICAVTGAKFFVIEVDMDKMMSRKKGEV